MSIEYNNLNIITILAIYVYICMMYRLYTILNYKNYSKPCGDMADVLMSLKHTVPTPQSSVDEQHQHDQAYGLSNNHNVSTYLA